MEAYSIYASSNSKNSSTSPQDAISKQIRKFHHVNECAVFVASLAANGALATLISTERSASLKMYSRVLLQNCFMDVAFTIVGMACEIELEITEQHFIVTLNGVLRFLPIGYHYCLNFIYAFFCAGALNIVPVMFYFRYSVVCRNKSTEHIRVNVMTSLSIFAALFEAILLTSAFYASEFGAESRSAACVRLLKNHIWRWDADSERRSATKCMFTDTLQVSFLCFLGMCIVMSSLIYVLMVYYGLAVFRFINSSAAKMSVKNIKVQRQMNRILIVQLLMPLFTGIIPTIFLVMLPLIRVEILGAGTAVLSVFTWIPLVSPVTTICLIASFRRRLFHAVSRPFCRQRQLQSVATMTSNNAVTNRQQTS